MDDSLRGKRTLAKKDGYFVFSIGDPYLSEDKLSLWGVWRHADDFTLYYPYDTEEEAIKAEMAFREMIEQINSMPEGAWERN